MRETAVVERYREKKKKKCTQEGEGKLVFYLLNSNTWNIV